jgi:hypothetical protein
MDIRSNKCGHIWILDLVGPLSTGPQPYRSLSLHRIPNSAPSPLAGNPLLHRPLFLSAAGRPFLEASRSDGEPGLPSPTLPPSPTASRQPCLKRRLRSLAAATPSSIPLRRRPPPRASPTSAHPDAFPFP